MRKEIKELDDFLRNQRKKKSQEKIGKQVKEISDIDQQVKLTAVEREMEKLKKEQEEIQRRDANFEEQIAKTRPMLNERATIKKLEIKSSKLGRNLADVMLNAISMNMALTFAQKMINEDIDGGGADLQKGIILNFAKKISYLPVISLLCDHFDIPEKNREQLLSLWTVKEWGPKASIPPQKDNVKDNSQQVIQSGFNELAKRLDNMSPYGISAEDLLKQMEKIR